MPSFSQKISKIGINPCVVPPDSVLRLVFRSAKKEKGPIPVRGTINGAAYKQTLVKFSGKWRLYINGPMLRNCALSVGEIARVRIMYDTTSREIPMHPAFKKMLLKEPGAKAAFEKLAPHRKKEVLRYLHNLKTKESLERNVDIVVEHLGGRKTRGLHALLRVPKQR